MNPKVVEEDGFTVVGIEARTNNARELGPGGVIPRQWARFMREALAEKIHDKADGSIVAVYSDYAGDQDGEYSFLIGARVTSAREVPSGMVVKKVPAGRYAVFISDKGPVEKVVPALWRRIWAVPERSLGGNRAYQADYELYDERAANPEEAQVDIHVGVR